MSTTNPSPIQRGINVGKDRSELYLKLYRGLPNHISEVTLRSGEVRRTLNVAEVASEIGVSKQKFSEWMKRGSLPGGRIAAILELSGCTLKAEDMLQFIHQRMSA